MSQQNDETFQKFMMQLAKKIMDRYESNRMITIAEADQIAMAYISHANPPASVPAGVTIYPADIVTVMTPISTGELEVIKAYFNGEDVLTTILSQER